jgi:hypothetical protein
MCNLAGALVGVIAYITDVSHWPHRAWPLKALFAAAAVVFFCAGMLLYVNTVR